MAVLENLLAVAIACVAVVNGVAGIPTIMPSHSLTETVTLTAELFHTTFTTTLTFTNGGGIELLSLPAESSVLPIHITSYPVHHDVDGALKRDIEIRKTVTVTVTTTVGCRNDIRDMTLSLSTSTTCDCSAVPSTIFPDPGVFGHPPPIDTASTKYTATTTPNFPVVASPSPDGTDGTRPAQHAVDLNTTTLGTSTTVTISDTTKVSLTGCPVYCTELTTPSTDQASSSSSLGKFCGPYLDGVQHHGHCHSIPTRTTGYSPLDGHQEHPHTKRQGSYSYGIPIPLFTGQILPPWESTNAAHQIPTGFVTQAAARFPTNLPGPPQARDKVEANAIMETASSKGTVSCEDVARAPMSALTDGTITTDIPEPICTSQPVSSIKAMPVGSSHSSETLHWTTETVTFTTVAAGYTFSTGKTDHESSPVAFPCTIGACTGQAFLPPGETPEQPLPPRPSGDLTLPWIIPSRRPWHTHNTAATSNGTTAHPTASNMDVINPSQSGYSFSTFLPGLFTPETDHPILPTGTPTLPHIGSPYPIHGGITVAPRGSFTTEKTTLETSMRSTQS